MSNTQPSQIPKAPSMPTPPEKSDKDYLVALLLAFFLGTMGFHRFYVGRIASGLLMMFTLGGLFIWAFIDFFWVVTGCLTDQYGRHVKP